MPLAVLALVLVAAVLHAAWNALLKASEHPLGLATRAVSLSAGISLPVFAAVWFWQGRPGLAPLGWVIAMGSAALELLYFIALSTAYRRGELSVVYPIARGTAPLLAVGVGLVLLGERLHVVAAVGVFCLLAGIWAVRRPSPAGAALIPALMTGVLIAAYSSLDRIGVRLGPPWLYAWVLWLCTAVFLLGYATAMNVPQARLTLEPRMSLMVGVLMTAAYFMILFALSVAPLAVVAPLRESAIVLVTAWGIWRLRERRGARLRLAGAVAIVVGITLLTIG